MPRSGDRERGTELWLVGCTPGVLAVDQKFFAADAKLGRARMVFTLEDAVNRYMNLGWARRFSWRPSGLPIKKIFPRIVLASSRFAPAGCENVPIFRCHTLYSFDFDLV